MAAVRAAQEAAATAVEHVTTILEFGEDLPAVGGLCTAVLKAKDMVDKASDNQGTLERLCARCLRITVQMVDKVQCTPCLEVDVSDLKNCVTDLESVVRLYDKKCCWTRLIQSRKDGDDIQELEKNIDTAIRDLTAAGVVEVGSILLQQLGEILARLRSPPKLAKPPNNAPPAKSSDVVRDGVLDRVCKILGGDGGPAVAALTGRSGAGKSTAAATMVGERGHIRPRAGETEDQACTRLDRVRALFADGVVWLRVGKVAADRLSTLMLKLAKRLHVIQEGVGAPELGEDGVSYVKRIVKQEKLKCLVVADDVWESLVVKKLRETGMWVLLTTRYRDMVEPNERVDMGTLTQTEAEDVLRRAARLPPGESLCEAATDVLKICGLVAMDIAFVGSWSTVHTTDDGNTKSKKAWERAVKGIEANGGKIEDFDVDVNRLAVLRAGFKYLRVEDALAQELYVVLAVFPGGHAFGESDAAVLLDDEEVATGPVSILERWGVLRADASGRYRMHDAHVDFARKKLIRWEDVREPAVERWTTHISRLDFAVGVDAYALLRFWQALEEVGGKGWWVTRPYDDQLVKMNASDPSRIVAVHALAELYEHDGKFSDLEPIMWEVLEHCDAHGGDCCEVQMAALYHAGIALSSQGKSEESKDVGRRLGALGGPGLQFPLPSKKAGFLQTSTTFGMYGVCLKAAGRMEDAEEWFRKALGDPETTGLTWSYKNVWTMFELAECLRDARRLGEAEEWLQRALKIEKDTSGGLRLAVVDALNKLARCWREAGRPGEAEKLWQRMLKIEEKHLGPDHEGVPYTLHELAQCAQEAGRPGEAEELLKRALEIRDKLGPDDVQVAVTLHELAVCVREAGRPGEAEPFSRRALGIKEAKLGRDDVSVAVALHELGRCVREAGRPGEAEALFQRALEILEAKLGPDDVQIAVTLHELAVCVREARRRGEAEPLFRRALAIREAKLGPDHVGVAVALHELAVCVRQAGRPGEAEALFRQALGIVEPKLGPDDVRVANTLHSLGLCVREAGRPGEAEGFFKRALEIKEAKLGRDDIQVAVTLHELAVCVRQAGRPGEAEALFRRVLEIQEAKLGRDDIQVAVTLHSLGRCVREAGQPGDAEALFRRALEIDEAKLGPDNVQVAYTLHELGLCVREAGLPGEAETLFKRALEIKEAKLGPDDLKVAVTLRQLGGCVREAGRPGEAVPLFQRALEIAQIKLGADHMYVAAIRLELGRCTEDAGGPAETEALFRRAMDIEEAKEAPSF